MRTAATHMKAGVLGVDESQSTANMPSRAGFLKLQWRPAPQPRSAMSAQKSTARGCFAWLWILLDRMNFQDSFALLKWKIESVTLAPLLTPEDTKSSRETEQFSGHSFSTRVEKY